MNITASIKGVIQRGVAQVNVRDGHLCFTLTDGTYLDLGVVEGRGITNASLQEDQLVLTFSDGATQNVGNVKGRGIQSIAKTGTAGKVDTYTVTYTDGSTWSYTVQNGKDAAFDGTLKGDFRLQGGAFRFQSSAGKDLLTLSATTDRDGTIRLGNANQPIRMGAIASPQTDTDAVSKGYVDRLLSDTIHTIDSLIGGNV